MGIAFVKASSIGSYSNIASSGTGTLALTGTTAGHMLLLLASYIDSNNAGVGLSNVSDGSNTWNGASTYGDSHAIINHQSTAVYSAYNIAGGNVTVTMTNTTVAGSSGYWKAIILEFSGAALSSANDGNGTANASGNSAGPVTCNTGPFSNAGDLVVVAVSVNAGVTMTTPSGWTSEGLGGTFPAYGFAYILPGSASALNPSYGTITANNWTISAAAYKPAPPTATAVWWQ